MSQLNIPESEFWSTYKPIQHPDGNAMECNGCMLDITDEDFIHVKPMVAENKVWTVVDTPEGLFIMAGLRFVNRYGYLITEKPWSDVNQFVDDGEGFPPEEKEMKFLLFFKSDMAHQAFLTGGSELLRNEFPGLYSIDRYTVDDDDCGLKDIIDVATDNAPHEYISKSDYEYLGLS